MTIQSRFWATVDRVAARAQPVMPRLATRVWASASLHYSEPELHLLPSLTDKAKLSLDVGANWGLYSSRLERLSRGVVAFEPNPDLAALLRRSLPRVRVEGCALGAEDGTARLSVPLLANGAAVSGWGTLSEDRFEQVRSFEVAVRRLDDFALRGVGFIKIDVEGFEHPVIEGALETIGRERPKMIVECSAETPDALAERMRQLGYAGHFYLDRMLRPIAEWRPEMRSWHGAAPNNLIFLPD